MSDIKLAYQWCAQISISFQLVLVDLKPQCCEIHWNVNSNIMGLFVEQIIYFFAWVIDEAWNRCQMKCTYSICPLRPLIFHTVNSWDTNKQSLRRCTRFWPDKVLLFSENKCSCILSGNLTWKIILPIDILWISNWLTDLEAKFLIEI